MILECQKSTISLFTSISLGDVNYRSQSIESSNSDTDGDEEKQCLF